MFLTTYNPEQQTIIDTLTTEQQSVMSTGGITLRGAIINTLTTPQKILFPTVSTLYKNYNPAQLLVIDTLTDEQHVVLASTSAQAKRTLIATLTIEQQAVFTSTPVQFIQTVEQLAADKLRIDQIIFKLKSGQFVNDDDSVFYSLGNSLMTTAAMVIIDAGGSFDGLRTAGLTQAQALSVLSIYNVNLDVSKYESEVALNLINNDPTKLTQLSAYLAGLTPPLTLPPLTPYLAQVRADHAVYAAIKNWSGS